jgi:hypothetical protein
MRSTKGMSIVRESVIVEFPETLEGGNVKKYSNKPYSIERLSFGSMIVWYGCNVNWRFKDGVWKILEHGKYTPCSTPEYEILYQKYLAENQ